MAKAESVVGAPVVAQVNVVGLGYNDMEWGRALGGVLGQAAAEANHRKGASPIEAGDKGFLVLTAEELVITSAGGLITLAPKAVLDRRPRAQVTGAELGEKNSSTQVLGITFADGSSWVLEVPRVVGKKGRDFVAQMGF